MASSLALFDKAGVDLPLVLILAIPTVIVLGLVAQHLANKRSPVSTESAGALPSKSAT